ncbi:MAG: family 16 glycoside hydrolase [Planctomycetaceae bacterium]
MISAARVFAAETTTPEWIWQGEPAKDQTVVFRKTFDVAGPVGETRLTIACDDKADVLLNGRPVLKQEGWQRPVYKNVADRLATGTNVLAVRAHNGDGPAGVLVKLEITTGGQTTMIVSNESWKASAESPDGWPQAGFDDAGWKNATAVATLGAGTWAELNADKLAKAIEVRDPVATPVTQIKALPGFQVELLYSVPQDQQGSWVNVCFDPQGRLIVSDQYGGLYRVTSPPLGTSAGAKIESLPLTIGGAHGLLWAFDSLYVVVNERSVADSGLYRITDSDGDGELDKVTKLRAIDGSGEHGPHAVLLTPDRQSLVIVCGNATKRGEVTGSRVPQVWDEDFLIPRLYGRGFMKGVPAPGGFVAKTDPEGKTWELISTGYRNEFDAAFNKDGELFTFDSDMEWDINCPWYRPTRVNHVVSGSEYGWRNGSAKWPAYYFDSLPAAVDVGPGSPTGICFGYGAKFPEKYQNALFLCDWSYGKLYAAHLTPTGASYGGTLEEFLTGTPLPLTDIAVGPKDGALYFTIGGRKVQSGLYRVTYVGGEPAKTTTPVIAAETAAKAATQRALRQELEALHRPCDGAVDHAWPHLGSSDRFIRYAARIAIEHQPVAQWAEKAIAETDTERSLAALLALARQQPRAKALRNDVHDPVMPDYKTPVDLSDVNADLKGKLLVALDRLDWKQLNDEQRLEWLRVYTVALARMGPPDDAGRQHLIAKFDGVFPTREHRLDAELSRLLVWLQSPTAASKIVELLAAAPSQEEQIDYAMPLRFLHAGWTDPLFEQYLNWFPKALGYRGGANFTMFIDELKQNAVALLSDEQKTKFAAIISKGPETPQRLVTVGPPRETVKEWTLEELEALLATGLHDRNFERGREMFGIAKCFACHRYDNEGGAMGPDLTGLAGRFSRRDLLEAVTNPDKVISDQYAAVQIVTTDGRVIVGRIVNLGGDSFSVNTNMLDPNAQVDVDRKFIEEMQPSTVSMMPKGLFNTLHADEILDLMAYLLSRGNAKDPMFAQSGDAGTTLALAGAGDAAPTDSSKPPDGFRAIFNSKDLTGWHGMPHFDPRELAKLEPDARKAKIDEWTADAKQHWSVDNGELVNDGHGAYLTTDEEFGDYELLIDYKTVPLADSGIYLKWTPQVQIWDWREEGGKWKLGADKGSGALWNNHEGDPARFPTVLADKPFGEWNSFRILQLGARTSVWLNGKEVVHHGTLENFWDRKSPLFPKGQIQLQTHGGEIRWRNIFVREIGAEEANKLLTAQTGDGYKSIFNGKDLSDWQGAVDNYEVVDGNLRCKAGHGGELFTKEEYGDFQVRLEFKLPPGGNNGLIIRYPGKGQPHIDGMTELQVLDTEHEMYKKIDPRQAHGSVYGAIPAARGFLRPTGEWNFQEVTVKGHNITVELNGNVILNADCSQVKEFMGGYDHPGITRLKGYFGFAGHNDPVEFRRVEIRKLDEKQAAVWPQFHGPRGGGRPLADRPLPEKIDPSSNIVWKTPLPPGHSSPVIDGDRIYLTAEQGEHLVTMALDRRTGKVLWQREAPHKGLEAIHTIGSHAQSSCAVGSDAVVSFFGSSGLFCYSRDGEERWHLPMGPFKNEFGAGSSPVIVGDRVILCQDHDTSSFLAMYSLENGSTVWQIDRSEFPRNYCTPVIWEVDGTKQIVIAATLRVVGYDFDTGAELWTARGLARMVCSTPVIGDDGDLYLAGWSAGAEAGQRIVIAPFAEKLAEVDANKNGTIEEAELAGEKGSNLERRFSQFDSNKDGSATEIEYESYRSIFDKAQNVVMAIRPGGRGDISDSHVRWRHDRHVPFCASPVVANGVVFGVKDGGILTTLDSVTGKPVKTGRLSGNGNYYASPVVGDGRVFFLDQNGELSVVTATGEWEELQSADFGEPVYATPAIADGRMYLRTAGHLYCFGAADVTTARAE